MRVGDLRREGCRLGFVCSVLGCLILVLCTPTVGLCTLTESVDIVVHGGVDGSTVGYATLYPNFPLLEPGESYTWNLPTGPGELYFGGLAIAAENDQSLILAVLNELDITVIEDPTVTLGFSVTASQQYTTSFSFSSQVLGFPAISNPLADASGQVSVGSGDTLMGSYPGGKIFRTLYNVNPDGTGGTKFADIVSVPPKWEVVTPQTIPAAVSNIHIKSQFILSAGGIASGTSSFTVIPEPCTTALFGLGIIMLGLKRKK